MCEKKNIVWKKRQTHNTTPHKGFLKAVYNWAKYRSEESQILCMK